MKCSKIYLIFIYYYYFGHEMFVERLVLGVLFNFNHIMKLCEKRLSLLLKFILEVQMEEVTAACACAVPWSLAAYFH